MKNLFVIFFRYDRSEEYSIYHVGTNRTQMKKQWRNDSVEFFRCGPDDVSQLYFMRFGDLTDEEFNDLTSDNQEIANKRLKTICRNGREWDSFGYDRNDCLKIKEEISSVDGNSIYDLLCDLYDEEEVEEIIDDDDRYLQEIEDHVDELF